MCYNYSGSIFDDNGGQLRESDILRVQTFLVYLLTAFFGVGNIARYDFGGLIYSDYFLPRRTNSPIN